MEEACRSIDCRFMLNILNDFYFIKLNFNGTVYLILNKPKKFDLFNSSGVIYKYQFIHIM